MDIFGNKKPIQIDIKEWWFNGRIIVNQEDSRLPNWISFEDNKSCFVVVHGSKKQAIKYSKDNPYEKPDHIGIDYV